MVKVDNNSFIINLQNVPAALENNLNLSPDRSIQDPIKMICRRISINNLQAANGKTTLCAINFRLIIF